MKIARDVLENIVRDTITYRLKYASETQLRWQLTDKLDSEEYKVFKKLIDLKEIPNYFLTARNSYGIIDSFIPVSSAGFNEFDKPSNLKETDRKYNLRGMALFNTIQHYSHDEEDAIGLLERNLDKENKEIDEDIHFRTISAALAKELGKTERILKKPFYWCEITQAPNKKPKDYSSDPYCKENILPCGHTIYNISLKTEDVIKTDKEIIDVAVANYMETIELHTYNSQRKIIPTEIVD